MAKSYFEVLILETGDRTGKVQDKRYRDMTFHPAPFTFKTYSTVKTVRPFSLSVYMAAWFCIICPPQ